MLSMLRADLAAGLLAVLVAIASFSSARAADKAFQSGDLANSAAMLEGQIKSDAGAPTKPLAQIRRDADAAFAKNDFRSGMALLGQIVAAAPNDSATWLRLAKAVLQIRPSDDSERTMLWLSHWARSRYTAEARGLPWASVSRATTGRAGVLRSRRPR